MCQVGATDTSKWFLPYDFVLVLHYEVGNGIFRFFSVVESKGSERMLFFFGYHADVLKVSPTTVTNICKRTSHEGLAGALYNHPRP